MIRIRVFITAALTNTRMLEATPPPLNGLAARRAHHPKVESSDLAQLESGAWLEHRIHNPMHVRVIHTLSLKTLFCGKSTGALRVAISPERRIFGDVNNGAY